MRWAVSEFTAEDAVEWLGVEAGDQLSEDGCEQDNAEEERGDGVHRLARHEEEAEERDDEEDVGEVDFVAALAQFAEGC